MDDCHNVAANCENWRELYEKEHQRLMEYVESAVEEYKARLEAEKYELMLRQQALKIRNGNDIKAPVPDSYCCDMWCKADKNEVLTKFKEVETSYCTLQPLIDKINALQTYKLAEDDTDILVKRDDVIKILKGE